MREHFTYGVWSLCDLTPDYDLSCTLASGTSLKTLVTKLLLFDQYGAALDSLVYA